MLSQNQFGVKRIDIFFLLLGPDLNYGQSTFESEYLFLNCSRMWNGFLCLPGQPCAVHRDSPGVLSSGCSQRTRHSLEVPWCWCCWSCSSPPHQGLPQGLPPKALPWSGWCISAHFWSKVMPTHLQAGSFSHLRAVVVAAVSQSRPDSTCAQVQLFPFPFLARSWQLPKLILWTFAQIC